MAEIGDTLGGRYRLIEVLGQGGAGPVRHRGEPPRDEPVSKARIPGRGPDHASGPIAILVRKPSWLAGLFSLPDGCWERATSTLPPSGIRTISSRSLVDDVEELLAAAPRLRARRPNRRVLAESEDSDLRRVADRLRGGTPRPGRVVRGCTWAATTAFSRPQDGASCSSRGDEDSRAGPSTRHDSESSVAASPGPAPLPPRVRYIQGPDPPSESHRRAA